MPPSDDGLAILIVDDRDDKLLALSALLEDVCPNIITAQSGRKALRRLLERDFAVILLDVNMPDMDGFETAALIRQRKYSEHTPIIFVTSFGDDMLAAQGY
ncbi:MAG TPA: response regulator, partial [Pirellulales bacterium]|nr:response regulator [Pirellulales bacterium]